MKKILTLLPFFVLLFIVGASFNSKKNDFSVVIDRYKTVEATRLLQIADSFLKANVNDSAMICYSLIYNSPITEEDTLLKKTVCKSLNRAATIYFNHCDYKSSLQLLLMALNICEEIDYQEYIGGIYSNIGSVYYQFKDYKSAKKYYDLSCKSNNDAYVSGIVLNNLAMLAFEENKLDSALLAYKKSCQIIRRDVKDSVYNETLNNIGNVYQNLCMYDSAFFYYRSALDNAYRFESIGKEAAILSNIGRLYYQTNQKDSAIHYLHLGNAVAEKHHLFNVLADNYLSFSEIEENCGHTATALEYYKKYSIIRDSLFNSSKYAKINELQFVYNMSKVDKQIQVLNMEQEIKEHTIVMQRRLQVITLLVLLMVTGLFIVIYRKNVSLNRAYNKLVSKNVEIVNFDRIIHQMKSEYEIKINEKELIINKMKQNSSDLLKDDDDFVKYKDIQMCDDSKNRLTSAILEVMNDKDAFCDPEFSVSKLADRVGSNSSYVSYIINNSFGKNFRSFINDYRIKEACRLLSDSDSQKYSIESIATMVGFKSKSTFNPIFKEVTGITPSFYIKSIKASL